MRECYYLYLLHETPIESPYFCKVGYTADPVKRLRELQSGNPRPLRSPDFERRPSGEFGFRLPSEIHARALEMRMFERFDYEGIRLMGDLDYEKLRASRREWVMGIHPDTLWAIMAREWSTYMTKNGLRNWLNKN
jgi:T5orf172 domain